MTSIPLTVSPGPPPNAVQVTPASNVQSVLDSAGPGAYIVFAPGTYSVSSLTPLPNQILDGQNCQAQLNGGGSAQHAITGNGNNSVTVKGFEITNYSTPLQQGAVEVGAYNWLIENCYIHDNAAAAVESDSGTVVQYCRLNHNVQEGFSVHGTGAVYQFNEVAFNNYSNNSGDVNGTGPGAGVAWWGWEAGGGKGSGGYNGANSGSPINATFRFNWVHDNAGAGLWFDTDAIETYFYYNVISNNSGAGIYQEVSCNATIISNIVVGNGVVTSPFGGQNEGWAQGAGITFKDSQGVAGYASDPCLIQGNCVGNNYNGIDLIHNPGTGETSYYAGSQPNTANVTVNANYVYAAQGGNGAFAGGSASFPANIIFTNNNWAISSTWIPGASGLSGVYAWSPIGSPQFSSFTTWQGDGNDIAGTSVTGAFWFPWPARVTASASQEATGPVRTVYTLFNQALPPSVNYGLATGTFGTIFVLSQPAVLTGIWYYSAPSETALPTECAIWDVASQSIVAGTLNSSPSWSGPLGSGWVKCSYDGSITLDIRAAGYITAVQYAGNKGYDTPVFPVTSGALTAPGTPQNCPFFISATFTYPATGGGGLNWFADAEVSPLPQANPQGTPAARPAITMPPARGRTRASTSIKRGVPASVPGPAAQVNVQAWQGNSMVTGDETAYGVTAQVTAGAHSIPGWVVTVTPRELWFRAELEPQNPEWLEEW